MPVADHIRELNEHLWAPDSEQDPHPALLVGLPVFHDVHLSVDGRSWLVAFLDGSTLDQAGYTHAHAPCEISYRRSMHESVAAA